MDIPGGEAILVLNAGSSSLKLALYALETDGLHPLFRGAVEGVGGPSPRSVLKAAGGETVLDRGLPSERGGDGHLQGLLADVLRAARGRSVSRLAAAGHRVVHGGPEYARPVLLTEDVLRRLDGLAPLAPLHQGHNLAPVRTLQRLFPGLPQVACFDTSFHHTLPDEAARFAIPRGLHESGVRRYGAHGLSYEHVAGCLAREEPALADPHARVVVAHLGSGASLCAMRGGRSVDTTMGLTPLDGLVMGTRCGALDPGVVLYLQQARGMAVREVEDLLYHRSGLLGVSGRSSDMRDLLRAQGAEGVEGTAARQAVALFVARLAKEVAGMAASLGGIDALVFTGGIGEHQPELRAAACAHLAFLGVRLDAEANRAGKPGRISAPDSPVAALVLPTDEETVVARHTRRLVQEEA